MAQELRPTPKAPGWEGDPDAFARALDELKRNLQRRHRAEQRLRATIGAAAEHVAPGPGKRRKSDAC